MRALAVAAVLLAQLLAGSASALGSCVQRDAAQLIEAADIVAYGAIGDDLQRIPYSRDITFRVHGVLKGSLSAVVRVRVGPELESRGPFTFGATSADYRPSPGEHVLYLRVANGLQTDNCAGSHPGGPNEDEVRALGAGVAPTPATLADEFAALGVYPFVAAGGLALAVIAAVLLARLRRRGGRKA